MLLGYSVFVDNFYGYFLWHFCSLFVVPTPHLSPSPLSAQLAPPPLHVETPIGVRMLGRGGVGGPYSGIFLGGGGESMCHGGGGGLYVLCC